MTSILFPVGLLLALLPIGFAPVIARAAFAGGSLWGWGIGQQGRRTIAAWTTLWALWLAGSGIGALFATDVASALQDWLRQAFVVAVAVGLARSLSSSSERATFRLTMLVAGILGCGYLLALFFYVERVALPTNELTNDFKFTVYRDYGILLNSLAFAFLMMVLAGMGQGPRRRAVVVGLAVVASISLGVVAGSVSTAAAIVMVAFVLVLCWILQRTAGSGRSPLLVAGVAFACAAGLCLVLFGFVQFDYYQASAATSGRTDLWLAAIGKFAARPLAGWGAGSWATGLLGFLPTAGAVTPTTLVSLPGGAAHNAYLTVAAEKGLLGLLPAVVMTIFLGRVAVELWQMRDRLANADRTTALLAPAAVCALVLHSLLEQPGLFGYGDSIADFATLGMASLLIGLRSTLEPSPRLTMLSFE